MKSELSNAILMLTRCPRKFNNTIPCCIHCNYRYLGDTCSENLEKESISLISDALDSLRDSGDTASHKEVVSERRIAEVLISIGVPAHLLGYRYLKYVVAEAYTDYKLLDSVTKELYPRVAIQFNTTSERAERAIRHAIEVAWMRGDPEVQHKVFKFSLDPDKGKPTNSEFIAAVVENLRLGDLI